MERRSFFRKEVDIPAELILSSGTRLEVRVRDVSGGGVQIQCDAFDSEAIAPHGNCLNSSGRPIKLDLQFAPTGKELKLHCRVIFVRRISHDEFRIGLRYDNGLQPDLVELEQLIRNGLGRD